MNVDVVIRKPEQQICVEPFNNSEANSYEEYSRLFCLFPNLAKEQKTLLSFTEFMVRFLWVFDLSIVCWVLYAQNIFSLDWASRMVVEVKVHYNSDQEHVQGPQHFRPFPTHAKVVYRKLSEDKRDQVP